MSEIIVISKNNVSKYVYRWALNFWRSTTTRLLELKACSLVVSVVEEMVSVLVAGMVPKGMVSGDFSSILIR